MEGHPSAYVAELRQGDWRVVVPIRGKLSPRIAQMPSARALTDPQQIADLAVREPVDTIHIEHKPGSDGQLADNGKELVPV